jgi:pimeloyl-ACP methyl ester carboxylesterase
MQFALPAARPYIYGTSMRRLLDDSSAPPLLEDVHFKSLYRKEIYDARTGDGWVLRISRYRPLPQAWRQPILDQPLLLVPGWSQNRHAFTAGTFVKQLLCDGADVHIVELRGHGLSSRELQQERAREEGRALPKDPTGVGTWTATSSRTCLRRWRR